MADSSSYYETENMSDSTENIQSSNIGEDISVSSSSISNIINSPFNSPDFKLEDPSKSKIYVFANGLFTRSLLPIDLSKDREMVVSCTTCSFSQIMKLKGFVASNLQRHYKRKHISIAYNKKSEGSLKRKLNLITSPENKGNFFNLNIREKRPKKVNSFNKKGAIQKVLNLLIENNLPFRIINSSSFQQLLSYYNSNSPTINRWNIKDALQQTYENSLQSLNLKLEANIQSLGTFSLVFDIWTASNQNAYLGIILAYINSDFKLEYKLIGLNYLNESHTGLYIYQQFLAALNIYPSITTESIFSITRDNASNNNRFLDTFKDMYKTNLQKPFRNDIRCISHILNITVQDILKEYLSSDFSDIILSRYTNLVSLNNTEDLEDPEFLGSNFNTIISRLRRLATIIKYTQEGKKLLEEGISKYKSQGILPSDFNKKIIPLDNMTRWNSTYYMINTAIILKSPIEYIFKNSTNKEIRKIAFTQWDWVALSKLEAIFKPFLRASIKLQGQLYVTLPYSLLHIHQLCNKLKELAIEFENEAEIPELAFYIHYSNAIQKGLEKLEKYFPTKLTPAIVKRFKPFILAILLDPRLKLAQFKPEGLLYHYPAIEQDIRALLKAEFESIKAKKGGYNPNMSFDELNPEFPGNNISSSDSDEELFISHSDDIEEYDLYLNENREYRKRDALKYWEQNSARFPILAILARRYLAIPATSAAIERIFSICGNIITKNRNRISHQTVMQLILLKAWEIWDLDNIEEELKEENWDEKGKEKEDIPNSPIAVTEADIDSDFD